MGSKDKGEYYIDRITRRNYEKGDSKKRYQKKLNRADKIKMIKKFGRFG